MSVAQSVEWLVAWRYLRDKSPSRWVLFILGIVLLALAGAMYGVERFQPFGAKARLFGLPLQYLAAHGKQIFGVLGLLTTIFGVCLIFFNLFTSISIVGVFLGVTALIVVLAVMSGFEADLRRKILGNNAHILVKERDGKPVDAQHLMGLVSGSRAVSWVEAVAPFIQGEVILTGPKSHAGVFLRGIDPESAARVSDIGHNIVAGVLDNLVHPERLKYLYFPPEGFVMTAPSDRESHDASGETPIAPAKTSRTVRAAGPADASPLTPRDGSRHQPSPPPGRSAAPVPAMRPGPRSHASPPPEDQNRPVRGQAGGAPSSRPKAGAPASAKVVWPRDAAGPVQAQGPSRQEEARKPLTHRGPLERLLNRDAADFEALMGPVALAGQGPVGGLARKAEKIDEKQHADQFEDAGLAPDGLVGTDLKTYPGIVVGKELAKTIGLRLGQTVDVVTTDTDQVGPLGPVPAVKTFRVAGIFYSGHYEFDSKYAYVLLSEAQAFLGKKGKITGLEIRVSNIHRVKKVAGQLAHRVEGRGRGHLIVLTWREIHKNLFSALELERLTMFLVLAIIVCVASFSIGANLIMVVRKKKGEIATLKAMGADDGMVNRIFVVNGLYVGFIGTGLGLVFGLGICMFIAHGGLALNQDVYYISRLPVNIRFFDILAVCLASLGISFVATVYPAWQAARLHPVEALRDE